MSAPVVPIVPSRRPAPARIVGFALLLAGVSWALGAFAAWPLTLAPADSARLRISLRHVPAFVASGERPSAEDIARLPAHMRPADPGRQTTGRRADVAVRVAVDGQPRLDARYRPTGFRRNGPVHAYDELALPPGARHIAVALVDLAHGTTTAEWAGVVRVAAGTAPLLEYRDGDGWQMLIREERAPGRQGRLP